MLHGEVKERDMVVETTVPVPFIYQPYSHAELDSVSKKFYINAMEALNEGGIPFLVGGAYAFGYYTKIERHTKDFDIFVKKDDAERVLDKLRDKLHCKSDRTFPHWLYKSLLGENFIDIIFSSGNGVAIVDDTWFDKAVTGTVLGVKAKLIPAEEMIWSKGYIMERERFDGADVAHVIRGWGQKMDWERLVKRYDADWRVLFSHLVLFGYIYPTEKGIIPNWVMDKLSGKIMEEQKATGTPSPTVACPEGKSLLCQGTLLSRQQYLKDVAEWRYEDARSRPRGGVAGAPPVMADDEIAHWTAAAFEHAGGGKP